MHYYKKTNAVRFTWDEAEFTRQMWKLDEELFQNPNKLNLVTPFIHIIALNYIFL